MSAMRTSATRRRATRRQKANAPRTGKDFPNEDAIGALAQDVAAHAETSPRLTGGDVDADWHGAWDTGDEAVGGSVSTPDQDVVDELGDALGVAQAPDAEVVTSAEILADRDRHRWELENGDDNGTPGRRVSRRRRTS
jgi:Family of unknown function (DUF6335)